MRNRVETPVALERVEDLDEDKDWATLRRLAEFRDAGQVLGPDDDTLRMGGES